MTDDEQGHTEEFERLKQEWNEKGMDGGFAMTAEGQRDFTILSLKLVRYEIGCMLGHAERGEWEELLFHLASDIDGLRLVFSAVLQYELGVEDAARIMAELTREKLEAQTGNPMSTFQVAPGIWALKQDEVVVPDNMDAWFDNE